MTDDTASSEGVRRTSWAIFGSGYRLELSAAIYQANGPVYARGLADQTGIRENSVHTEVKALVSGGLLVPLEKVGNRQYYAMRESVFWELCARLKNELEAE